jgi:pimeloyl-ACP methyl ester carboxylesterase
MPGCGTKRGRDVSSLSVNDVVAELNQDVRDLGVTQAVLLGHSIAGALLPLMAVGAPDLYRHLVYLTCALPGEGQSILEQLGNTLHGDSPDHVGWPLDPAKATPQEMAMAMFGQDLSPDTFGWLLTELSQDATPPCVATESITRAGYEGLVPATYIITLRDNILPAAWQRRFAERAGAGTVLEIDTAHEPFVSHPQMLAAVIRDLELPL